MTNQQIITALTGILDSLTPEEAPEAPVSEAKPTKADKKASNKARYSKLQGTMISAGQAFKAGDKAKAKAKLSEAYVLASEPTPWVAQQARVLRKCEEFGFPVKQEVLDTVAV